MLSRLLGRVLAGLALVWIVALVAWPERTMWVRYEVGVSPAVLEYTARDSSFRLLFHFHRR